MSLKLHDRLLPDGDFVHTLGASLGISSGTSTTVYLAGGSFAFLIIAIASFALIYAVRWSHNNAIALDRARLSKTVREIVRDTKLYETQDRGDSR